MKKLKKDEKQIKLKFVDKDSEATPELEMQASASRSSLFSSLAQAQPAQPSIGQQRTGGLFGSYQSNSKTSSEINAYNNQMTAKTSFSSQSSGLFNSVNQPRANQSGYNNSSRYPHNQPNLSTNKPKPILTDYGSKAFTPPPRSDEKSESAFRARPPPPPTALVGQGSMQNNLGSSDRGKFCNLKR
jgi:hypothetical protein